MPFARRLDYGAHDGEAGASFIALIELAGKKGGKPTGFVLYRRVVQYDYPTESETKMIRLKVATAKEAVKRYGLGGKEFPGHWDKAWETTTFWLYPVAVGGGYEQFPTGTWVKVGRPARRKWRHKKRRLQFGNLGHILLARQTTLRGLENEKLKLELERSFLEEVSPGEVDETRIPEANKTSYDALSRELEGIEAEIEFAEAVVARTKAEMRYKVRKMFPKPAGKVPKRLARELLARSR